MSQYIEKLNKTNPITESFRKKFEKELPKDIEEVRKYTGNPVYNEEHVYGKPNALRAEKKIKTRHNKYKKNGKK